MHNDPTRKIYELSQNLEDLEIYLSDLWELIPLPLCYVNSFGVILEANTPLEALLRREAQDLSGERVDRLFVDAAIATALHQAVFAGESVKKEAALRAGDGTEQVVVEVSAAARRDVAGRVIGYYLAFFDITELSKLQHQLEDSVKERTTKLDSSVHELRQSRLALMNILEEVEEAKMVAEEERTKAQAIIDNFADALLFFDKTDTLKVFNNKAEGIFHLKAADVVGKTIEEIKEIEGSQLLIRVIERVEEVPQLSREELAADEERIFEITSLHALKEGEDIGMLIVVHDITREKRVERLKSEFVSIAAHQLRTPLSAIKWTLKMLLDGDLGNLNKEQVEFIEKTFQSNERMISLINDLLNVTRIEEGRYIYDIIPASLERVAREIADSFEEEMVRKDISFGFLTPEKSLPQVRIDVEKVGLVIQNLIDNAIKYTPEQGNITLSLLQTEDEYVELQVTDSGVGIPEKEQSRVFSRFYRGGNIVKLDTTGTGLGLFIAKNIIEAHGGRIWFDSTPGEGTTFHFTIPFGSKAVLPNKKR